MVDVEQIGSQGGDEEASCDLGGERDAVGGCGNHRGNKT